MLKKVCGFAVIVCLVVGASHGQVSNSLDFDIEKQLKDPNFDAVQKKLAESGLNVDFNQTNFNAEQIEDVLRNKCKKLNATDSVDELKEQQEAVKQCLTAQVNITQIQDELEEAKKTGSMEDVFAKYCKKWPTVYACMENATNLARECMTPQEQKAFNKSLDIAQKFQEFMCDKDGDRLAMFVAEEGVYCIQNKSVGIQDCLQKTVGARLPETDDLTTATLPVFLFSDEDCDDFDKVRICVNEVLEQCTDTTPANIVDSALKFLKKQMPCAGTATQSAVASVSSTTSHGFSWSASIFITLVVLGTLLKMY